VRRSLERGFPQGWDLHAHQLPTRFLATYAYYREGYAAASGRLRAYLEHAAAGGVGGSGAAAGAAGPVLDEPATARALAGFVLRGVRCGAISADEVVADTGLGEAGLVALAHPRAVNA
jgi:hypothetical protein